MNLPNNAKWALTITHGDKIRLIDYDALPEPYGLTDEFLYIQSLVFAKLIWEHNFGSMNDVFEEELFKRMFPESTKEERWHLAERFRIAIQQMAELLD